MHANCKTGMLSIGGFGFQISIDYSCECVYINKQERVNAKQSLLQVNEDPRCYALSNCFYDQEKQSFIWRVWYVNRVDRRPVFYKGLLKDPKKRDSLLI